MERKARILITGFEPFGKYKKNPSWEVVKTIKHPDIATVRLPVDYTKSHRVLLDAIKKLGPKLVFCSGVSSGKAFAFETRPRDARHKNKKARKRAPLTKKLLKSFLPALSETHETEISEDAGMYVCEHIAYWHARFSKPFGFRGCFIHVPAFDKCPKKRQQQWFGEFLKLAVDINVEQ